VLHHSFGKPRLLANAARVFTGWNIYDGLDNEYAFRLFYDRLVIPAAEALFRR